jgi:predicted Zn finger-like uncharacterized protein
VENAFVLAAPPLSTPMKPVVYLLLSCIFVQVLAFRKLGFIASSKRFNYQISKLANTVAAIETTASIAPATNATTTIFHPHGTSYCMCSFCKTAYIISVNDIGLKGRKVGCSVCNKEWYQTVDKLMKTDDSNYLTVLSESKIKDVQRIIADRNTPRYPRTDRVEVFVGNLPYHYTEDDIGALMGEYGINGVTLVKDQTGQSKGFAFIEVSLYLEYLL